MVRTSVGARARELSNRMMIAWPTPDASGWRHLPFSVLVLVVAYILYEIPLHHRPLLLAAGVAVALAVQAAASLGRPARWPPGWRLALPLGQMLAVGLLDLGSGDPMGSVIMLLFVPGVSLALAPGGRPLLAGLLGVVVVSLVPVIFTTGRLYPGLHSTINAVLIGAVMLHVHAIMETTRRQERQLLAAYDLLRSIMLAATEQAIMATDETGRLLTASSGAERLFEVPREQLRGTDLTELVDGPSLGELVGAAADGGSHVSLWRRSVGSSPRMVEYVVTSRPSIGPADEPDPMRGYLVVATDVTDREEELRRQEQLIGLVSHELRTPLVSILGYVDLLRLDPGGLTDEQREYVDVLTRNARRLRSLVDELLMSARVVAGDPMSPEEVDAVQVARAAIASVRPMAEAADVRVALSGDEVVPLVSDPQRLGQVVDNLLTNAIKYSDAGGEVRVEVVAEPSPDGQRGVRIRVADDGTGITADELRRITQPFYRTRDTRRRHIAGVGLGLTLVQALVSDHRGTLVIDSEPGRGTEVTVRLPDVPLAADPEAAPPR
ncbi:cell wall metabolism sensor histidine kinase WalK [Nocardioides sp. zg-1228]|uniref:sensor histidine kinase n=1 Tax=Nocardioides sp. zg-1228 TaxID=2763008 RepID=UPI001642481C|nr:ATP-binding protein [Nocardioides sp. zg-1228]MBC2934149.1 PAS domain-containing sensor histidine kinase [Nocardioides sp. zg-1228]QSF58894.1 PAS domain-containing sensor histidine kinase [Nocardioides sp. zg-1228]